MPTKADGVPAPKRSDPARHVEEADRRHSAGEHDLPAEAPLNGALLVSAGPRSGSAALPSPLAPLAQRQEAVLRLQRVQGNAFVARMLANRRGQAMGGTTQSQRAASEAVVQRVTLAEAKAIIEGETDSPGTDEDAIYDAISGLSEADRLKLKSEAQEGGSEVRAWLKSELEGFELLKAGLLLEYGSRSAFPLAAYQLWMAAEQQSSAEELIKKALRDADPRQITRLRSVVGLKDVMDEFLEGSERWTAEDLLTGGYARAIESHKFDVYRMKETLDAMLDADEKSITRRTAEWFVPRSPGARAKLELRLLTETHDAEARAKHNGKPGQLAYFGTENRYPSYWADYDPDIGSTRNIEFDDKLLNASSEGGLISVLNARKRTIDVLQNELVHEVQHEADQHKADLKGAGGDGTPQATWIRYKTEFRAFWVEGQFEDKDPSEGTATEARFTNARQQAIFKHMWGVGGHSAYSDWLYPVYEANSLVDGKPFQDLVHEYKQPEGLNLRNSPQLDDFIAALNECKPSDTDVEAPPLKDLLDKAKALPKDDQEYNFYRSSGAPLEKLMRSKLSAQVLPQVATAACGTRPGWLG